MFNEIKNSLNIKRVMQEHGIEFDQHDKCRCFVHNERTSSVSIKNNRFHCFGCGADGDVIDFISIIMNLNLQSAGVYLDQRYSLNADKRIINQFDSLRCEIKTLTKKLKDIEDEGKNIAFNNHYAEALGLEYIDLVPLRNKYKETLSKLNIAKNKIKSPKFYRDIANFYDSIISLDERKNYEKKKED